MSSSASLSVAGAVWSVADDDVGWGFVVGANDVIKGVATGVTGVAWVQESPVDADILSAASPSLAAAVWSAVDNTVAIGVTGVAVVHVSPVNTHVPSSASVSLATAVTSNVSDDFGGGVIVGYYTDESPVVTNTTSSTSLSLAVAVRSVVHDDVGGGFGRGAHDVTLCAPTGVTGAACVHVSPVDTEMPSPASLSLVAALSSVVHADVVGGVVVCTCAVTA